MRGMAAAMGKLLLPVEALQVQAELSAAVLLLAFHRGAAPERILAVAVAALCGAHWLCACGMRPLFAWLGSDLGSTMLDCQILAGACMVAMRANRSYPLGIGGAQIVVIAVDLLRMFRPEISQFAHQVMAIAASWVQLGVLAAGLAGHIRRQRTHGRYPSWRKHLTPLPEGDPKLPETR